MGPSIRAKRLVFHICFTTLITFLLIAQSAYAGQPSGGSFRLSASPIVLRAAPGRQALGHVASVISGGFNSSISLSASGQPAGTSITFNPNPIAAPGSGTSAIVVLVGSSATPGTYPITITGNGGGVQQTAVFMLVIPSTTNFTISASPSSLTVPQGSPGTSTITSTINGGFNSAIVLVASGQPSGTTVNFSPDPIPAPGSGNTTMTMTVGASTPAGTYPITVTANGGGVQQQLTVTLTVTTATPNFSISASPTSLTIPEGQQANSAVTTAISGGFNSSISLSASGQPSGATVSFNPNPIPAPGSGTSTMTIAVGTSTPTGTYPITITGNGGGVRQTTTVNLTVTQQQQQQQNFSMLASPIAVTLQEGNQGSSTLTSTVSGGFNSSIALSAASLPTGVTVTFNPSTIPAPGSGSSTMTINVASGTLSGSYPIVVTGTGGGVQRTSTMAVTVTTSDTAGAPFPTPPQAYVDTTWNPPTTGTTWNVGCTGNPANDGITLQNNINSAHPGDTIIVQAGCTYAGNINLPPKNPVGGQWIYIQSSGLASLPPPGTRVSPAYQQYMATVTTTNTTPAILAECSGGGYCTGGNNEYGANHFRLVGLNLTSTSTYGCEPGNNPPIACWSYYIFAAQSPDDGSTSYLADSITLDRCYIHGLTNGASSQDVSHGIGANATNFAVIDSYISDIHITGTEAQGILAYYTPGPIKIVDDYISSSTQEIMLGGAGGVNNPYVASDVEIRNNTLYKPTTWDSCGTGGTLPPGAILPNGSTCPSGNGAPENQWIEKNNLEIKSAQRVAITGNTLQNTWVSGQTGSSVLFTVRTSQSGNNAVVDDILFQGNTVEDVDSGMDTLEQDDLCALTQGCTNPGETRRNWVNDNLFLISTNRGYLPAHRLVPRRRQLVALLPRSDRLHLPAQHGADERPVGDLGFAVFQGAGWIGMSSGQLADAQRLDPGYLAQPPAYRRLRLPGDNWPKLLHGRSVE